jgi:alcohol dehydrogenase (quinone), cytochrome c subunit
MRTIKISAAAALFALASLAQAQSQAQSNQAQSRADSAMIARGEYIARASDCIACHTAVNGKPFAGGLKLDTPIGPIYSSNITPDASTGIGSYTVEEFDRTLREGVKKNGDTLYPAMPYPSYSRLSDADVHALYAYFMHGVSPVQQSNRATGIVWPLSMRWPLALWRTAFAPKPQPFTAPAGTDPVLARGAYLVQGAGHCGACHTPRAVTMQEKALTDADGLDYLSGGAPVDGWVPASLRGEQRTGIGMWSESDIVQFLKTGRSPHTAAFGGMTDVVAHSMQFMSDDDLSAIARYLKSLPPKLQGQTPYVYDDTVAKALRTGNVGKPGAAVYRDNCMGCHRSDGTGYTRVFPALGGNPVVQGEDASSLIHVVLSGNTLPGVRTAPSSFTMPPLGWRLSDQEVADVSNFVRTSWGNTGSVVTAEQVAKMRKLVKPPGMPPIGGSAEVEANGMNGTNGQASH